MSGGGGDALLGFDFGLRRIGVAVGNRLLDTASALTTLPATNGTPDFDAVAELIRTWQPARLVVGLPRNMDGSDGEMTPLAERFARRLHGRFSLPVSMVDERLSSAEAEAMIRSARRAGRKRRARSEDVDMLAAEVILRSYLEHGGEDL